MEYKVVAVKTPEDAEAEMNEHSLDGWSVVAVTSWQTTFTYQLVITFERPRDISH